MDILGKAQGRKRAQELFKTFCNDQKDQPGWELNATYAGCVMKAYQRKKECLVCRTKNILPVYLKWLKPTSFEHEVQKIKSQSEAKKRRRARLKARKEKQS
ncbi:hypothetical protein CPB85DRAFT_1260936 [Mucidula mucida]|nr:hypothetical protein CPB85DRAFT_1260936 [Mucidula mucida]